MSIRKWVHDLTAENSVSKIRREHQIKESNFFTSKRILLTLAALVALWYLHDVLAGPVLQVARDIIVALIYGLSITSAASYLANAYVRKAEIESHDRDPLIK